jgi:hypothetical protein
VSLDAAQASRDLAAERKPMIAAESAAAARRSRACVGLSQRGFSITIKEAKKSRQRLCTNGPITICSQCGGFDVPTSVAASYSWQ